MINRMKIFSVLCLLLALQVQSDELAPDASAVVDSSEATESPRSWTVGLSLGAGQRSNPLVGGDDIDLWWSLDIAWFGERWFFDNGDLGFTLRDTSRHTLNIVARVNTERAFFSGLNEGLFNNLLVSDGASPDPSRPLAAPSDNENEFVFNPGGSAFSIPDRDYALETGLEYLYDLPNGQLHAQLMADVSGAHEGYELWLNYSIDLVFGRWHVVPSMTVNWKSKNLNDYYFGVRDDEVGGGLQAYQASAGLNASVKLSASYYFSEQWRLAFVADYERINDEAAGSPLLADDYIVSYFAGVHYAF